MPSTNWLKKNGFKEDGNFFCDRCMGFKMMACWVYDHGCGTDHKSCYGCMSELTDNFSSPSCDVSCYYCDTGNSPSGWNINTDELENAFSN